MNKVYTLFSIEIYHLLLSILFSNKQHKQDTIFFIYYMKFN